MKLPVVSARELIKCLEKQGYVAVRQTGSHIRMWHKNDKTKKPITVPAHHTIGRGILRKILRDAEISVEEFNELL